MQKKEFNQTEYIKEYIKKNYKKFACDIKKEEWENIDELLKEKKMNKPEFVRWAYSELKKNKI